MLLAARIEAALAQRTVCHSAPQPTQFQRLRDALLTEGFGDVGCQLLPSFAKGSGAHASRRGRAGMAAGPVAGGRTHGSRGGPCAANCGRRSLGLDHDSRFAEAVEMPEALDVASAEREVKQHFGASRQGAHAAPTAVVVDAADVPGGAVGGRPRARMSEIALIGRT